MQFTRYSGNIFQLQQTDQNNFIYDSVIKKLDVFGDSLTVPKEQCCSKHFANLANILQLELALVPSFLSLKWQNVGVHGLMFHTHVSNFTNAS